MALSDKEQLEKTISQTRELLEHLEKDEFEDAQELIDTKGGARPRTVGSRLTVLGDSGQGGFRLEPALRKPIRIGVPGVW